MIKTRTKTKKEKFVGSLRRLAVEIRKVGIDNVNIEDGELAYMLTKASNLIDDYAPDELDN